MVEERRVAPTFSTHSATLDLADVDKTVESLKMEVSNINWNMKSISYNNHDFSFNLIVLDETSIARLHRSKSNLARIGANGPTRCHDSGLCSVLAWWGWLLRSRNARLKWRGERVLWWRRGWAGLRARQPRGRRTCWCYGSISCRSNNHCYRSSWRRWCCHCWSGRSCRLKPSWGREIRIKWWIW